MTEEALKGVRKLTEMMRTETEPEWVEVRERLEKESILPNEAVLGAFEPDGSMMTGFILTRTGRMFEFDIDWGFTADKKPRRPEQPAPVINWTELEGPGLYSGVVALAEKVLADE